MNEQIRPEVIVGALVFNQAGKIFLMTSHKLQGQYGLAGGHIEMGETAKVALRREMKEETNLDVFDIQFLMVQECIFSEEFYEKKHFIFLDYVCKTDDTEVILDKNEGTEYLWVTIDQALELPLSSFTRNAILEYKKWFVK